jgi:hypothetical protein
MTFRIYDYLESVDLDTQTVAMISPNGYRQLAAEPLPKGGFALIEEKPKFQWLQANDDERATVLQALTRLGARARANASPSHPHYYDPDKWVILEDKKPTESNSRFARLYDVQTPSLDPKHGSRRDSIELALTIVRDGAWRGIEPGSAATSVVATTRLNNYIYGGDVNYVTIAPAAIPGDLEAKTIINVARVVSGGQTLMVARVTADSLAELDARDLWFPASACTGETLVDVATTSVKPGPLYLSATPDGKMRQSLASNLFVYHTFGSAVGNSAGTYRVYGVFFVPDPDISRAAAGSGFSSAITTLEGGYGDMIETVTSNGWQLKQLGILQLPPGGLVRGKAVASGSAYNIQWKITAIDGSTVQDGYFGAGFMIPTHEQVFATPWTVPADELVIDGELRQVYWQNSIGELMATGIPPEGDFISLQPGKYNRLYFFMLGPTDEPQNGIHIFTQEIDVSVSIIPTYSALRGNS